jgi:aminomethyltransferase
MEAGRAFDIRPTGIYALDVARIEAGLIMLDVDYTSTRRAVIGSQRYSPFEIGLGKSVHLDKAPFIGQPALRREAKKGPSRQLVGIEVDWTDVERLHEDVGLAPALPATAQRATVPIYRDGIQVGYATSTTWSPTLKRMIALATLSSDCAEVGTKLQMELTVDHKRKQAGVSVAKLPFFNPARKTA